MFVCLRHNYTSNLSQHQYPSLFVMLGLSWEISGVCSYQRSPSADYLHSLPRDHCESTSCDVWWPGGIDCQVRRRSEDNKECDCRCCAALFIISYFIITIVLVPGRAGTREEREVHNDGLKHNNNVRFMPAIFYNHLIHLVLYREWVIIGHV